MFQHSYEFQNNDRFYLDNTNHSRHNDNIIIIMMLLLLLLLLLLLGTLKLGNVLFEVRCEHSHNIRYRLLVRGMNFPSRNKHSATLLLLVLTDPMRTLEAGQEDQQQLQQQLPMYVVRACSFPSPRFSSMSLSIGQASSYLQVPT